MALNIEIKAKSKEEDIKKIKKVLKLLRIRLAARDEQKDIYFKTKSGRLKLRFSKIDGAYLIPYLRKNQSGAKQSTYLKIPIEQPDSFIELFAEILGIHCIVNKKRDIYLYENVRIHLDRVEELGTFIEFEAVCNSIDEKPEQQENKIDYMINKLGIKKEHLLAESYESMMIQRKKGL